MPIRFRCAYCNQLMGISRRKAGSVVRCPKCAGEVIVPTPPDLEPAEQGAQTEPKPGPEPELHEFKELLENSDFGDLLNQPPSDSSQTAANSTATAPAPVETAQAVEETSVSRPGVSLPRWVLILSAILVVLMLGTTFLLGFLAGYFYWSQ